MIFCESRRSANWDVKRKETAWKSEAVVKRSSAPASSLPLRMREAFWAKFGEAA